MKNISVRNKLLILLAAPLICLILLSIASVSTFQAIDAGIGRIYDDRVVPLKQLKQIADDYAVLVIDAVNKADHGITSPTKALDEIRAAKTRIHENWSAYMKTQLTQEEGRLANDAKALFAAADKAITSVESTLKTMGSSNKGELSAYNGPLYKQIDPISEKIAELIELQLRVAGQERDAAEALYHSRRTLFVIVAVVVVGLVASFGFLTSRSISNALTHIKETIERSERDADLTLQVDIASSDELGQLAAAYQKLMNHFREIIQQVRTTNTGLNHEASQLSTLTEQTRSNTLQQQNDTDQAATASTEMSSTVEEVALNAQRASDAAIGANTAAQDGTKVMAASIVQIHELSSQMEQTGISIQQVASDSNAIGAVLDVIKSIADQTNLLALNAAIEAARAGEQGRGFAVVADEVRSLAQRTQESTQEIQAMIERLQAATEKAVHSTEQVRGRMSQTQDNSTLASEALVKITSAIAMISDMNLQIATATEEQSQVSQEINASIVNIANVSRSNVGAVDQIGKASLKLSEMSDNMERMVGAFKV